MDAQVGSAGLELATGAVSLLADADKEEDVGNESAIAVKGDSRRDRVPRRL